MNRRSKLLLLVPLTLIGLLVAFVYADPLEINSCRTAPSRMFSNPLKSTQLTSARTCTYRIVKTYPHDRTAFTQGLIYENGAMYEGTGLNGSSSLRRVELESGNVLQRRDVPIEYFGEGITLYDNKIIQLTWQSHVGFVYDRDTFELLRQFNYPTEGWGITHDGARLIMSDGTSTLRFLDPQTFTEIGHVDVADENGPVAQLNELEYINGLVFANVWQTDRIARIDPRTGRVTAWIDLQGLLSAEDRAEQVDVLNGIAYDETTDRLFVTGKWWPKLFEIDLVPVASKTAHLPLVITP